MKVVQVLPDLNSGGVEKGTLEIAAALVGEGHESVVISAGGRMVDELVAAGSRHVVWDLGKKSLATFKHIWSLRRWLQQEKPDILHVRSRMPAWVVWFAWRGMPENERPHLVTTVHGLYSVSWYSEIMCKGERVIAVSKTVESYIRDNYPKTDMSKVELIYRGVDPEEFPYGYKPSPQWLDQWRNDYPQLEGKRVVTLPGRLTRLKGHHDFIDVIKAMKEQGEPVHGLIVGGVDPKRQDYAKELQQRVEDEKLQDYITFTGARSDIRDVFAVSDLVLSLSTKPESFGRTVLEALSLGVPVVGYGHGGVKEILTALYPEGLCKMGDTDAIVSYLADTEKRHSKIQKNEIFLKELMIGSTVNLYKGCSIVEKSR